MSASYLWVHVKEARISEPDPNSHANVQATVQLASTPSFTTSKALSPNPKWNEDVMLTLKESEVRESLSVEVFKPGFFFGRELLGRTVLPLFSARHSNKPNEGFWVNLFLPSAAGPKVPTQHQVRLDMHFELPKDIPADVVEALERKLETLNNVQEETAEVLQSQELRLQTGDLTPPAIPGGRQRVTEIMQQEVQVETFSSPNPYMDEGDRAGSPSEDFVDVGGSLTPSPEMDIPLEFEGFEWSRDTPSPHPGSSTTAKGRPLQQSGSLKEPTIVIREPEPYPRPASLGSGRGSGMDAAMGSLHLRDHNEGASAHKATRRGSGDMDFDMGRSHGAGLRSETNSADSIPYCSVRAHGNWIALMKKILPQVRQQIAMKPSFPGLITLSQLVDQLQNVKIKSMKICEQNIGTFSSQSGFRDRSQSMQDVKKKIMNRKHSVDDRVKVDVYKRSLEALLYPASEPDSHAFEAWSARKPTTCSECNYLLWGLKKQGVKCTRCGKICHERCATLCSQDCFMHDQHSAIGDKMHRMMVNHANRFDLLQLAFGISKEQHEVIKEKVMTNILKLADNFNATITISVLSAQALLIPKNHAPRVYVSVAVGNESKKTEVFKRKDGDKTSPTWDGDFMFKCYNYHDAIQFRVWNERDSAISKVATKFTKEGDHFLGQKIIEVRRVGTSQEVWYKLEKRTEKGPDVTGHIKVNISVDVEGELATPFHLQYIKLHEQMFFYCHVNCENDLIIVPPKMNPGSELRVLPAIAQEIVDEFALRYAVEPIFRMMIHIELLVNHHSIQKALLVINNMLKNLKYQMFIHIAADHAARGVGASTLMEEYMDASNFGRDKFCKLLDKLLNSLMLDLQQYRAFYPHKDEQKLMELMETFELMATVIEFQQQALSNMNTGKPSQLIVDSMKECLKSTFDFIVQNNLSESCAVHPALDPDRPPFDFFYQCMVQIKSVILEDRTVYEKYIPGSYKINLGDISALELWHLFSSMIEGLFNDEANLEVFPPNEYITLLFTIKNFYDVELKSIAGRQDKVPEYPRWFVEPVQRWLKVQYQKEGMFFLDNAWEDDKNREKFQPHENQKLSSSTFQMFFYLHEGLEFVLTLESADVEIKWQHCEDFSLVITNIVQYYVDKISVTIPEYTSDLKIMCMLLNNLQASRVNINYLFEEMGGVQRAGDGASRVLTDFQQVLSKQLTSWCGFVAKSLYPSIAEAIKTVQDTLIKLKSQGSIDRVEVKEIIEPLFDLLADKLSIVAVTSEQFVLQKVIKEVWYVCVECMHHMLLPTIKWEHDGPPTTSVSFLVHHYTNRQCTALEITMELLKDFFQAAESQGIKISTIERGIKQLKGVIALYRETTEQLISSFILDKSRASTAPTPETYTGDVYLAVEAYCHTNSGEMEGTIRVVSAASLKGISGTGNLRPLVELTLVSPTISSFQRKFVTHPAKSSYNPSFNETFKFTLANWEASELVVVVKHHTTFGKDKVIGMASVPCKTLIDQASLVLSLESCFSATDMGQAILNVLSARTSFDEFAKDFIALKTSQRCEHMEEGSDASPAANRRR